MKATEGDGLPSNLRGTIRSIYARIVAQTLASAADIVAAPAPYDAFGEYGKRFETVVFGFASEGCRGKWSRFCSGVMMSLRVRKAACRAFPIVLMTLASPLWTVLLHLEQAARLLDALGRGKRRPSRRYLIKMLNQPLRRLHINQRPFLEASPTARQRLMLLGEWPVLSIQLAVLASRAPQYQTTRCWLARRFALVFLLHCLHPNVSSSATALFLVIDQLMRRGVLWPVPGWPQDVKEFEGRLARLATLEAQLRLEYCLSEAAALRTLRLMFHDLSIFNNPKPGQHCCVPFVSDLALFSAEGVEDLAAPAVDELLARCARQRRWRADAVFTFKRLAYTTAFTRVLEYWLEHDALARQVDWSQLRPGGKRRRGSPRLVGGQGPP